jgi:hypothetical protein
MNLVPKKRRGEAVIESIILGIPESVRPYEGRLRLKFERETKKTLHEKLMQCL